MTDDVTDRVLSRWAEAHPDSTRGPPGDRSPEPSRGAARETTGIDLRPIRPKSRRGGRADALRVSGPSYRLSRPPGRGLMLSSAGVTSRIDRLERRGLVRRLPDPDDRRGIIVELTDQGLEVVTRRSLHSRSAMVSFWSASMRGRSPARGDPARAPGRPRTAGVIARRCVSEAQPDVIGAGHGAAVDEIRLDADRRIALTMSSAIPANSGHDSKRTAGQEYEHDPKSTNRA